MEHPHRRQIYRRTFLSIQAQDFIEDTVWTLLIGILRLFLSIQAQDFIEDSPSTHFTIGK